MKIQTRLSLYCSLIFGIIYAIISLSVFVIYQRNAERSLYKNLEKTAYISALFYLEEDELNVREFDKIRIQFEEIVANSYYQVYDMDNKVAYGLPTPEIPIDILDNIRESKLLSFSLDDFLCYGIFYEDNQGDFVVIAKERKSILDEQVKTLLWILIPVFFVGLIAIILLSRWVSRLAYRPFSDVIKQVKSISTEDLDVRISSPKMNDELCDLIETFNDLLEKISETVVVQRNFVKYVSHEFKTPLASMLGNLDLFSLKDRNPEDYKQLSEKLIRQIIQMEEILDTLIVISDLKKDTLEASHMRIDELLWEIIGKIKELHPSSKIRVNIDIEPEDEQLMSVNKDRTQLLIALINLIENAVKYSQKGNVVISVFKSGKKLCLTITDTGIGIPAEKLDNISKPFYRADNTHEVQGSGIGLSLALRIFDKNDIIYRIESEVGKGTKVFIEFE